MKVLQVPFCFYPDPVGGTEIYVEALARGLRELKEEVVIAAPGDKEASYRYGEIPVRRYPVSSSLSLKELYGEGDPGVVDPFCKIIEEEKPDIVHFHALTAGVSVPLFRAAHRLGKQVFFTYHTPTISCQRGTLYRWGSEVCDGVLRLGLCARCTLHGKGLAKPAANAVGSTPVFIGNLIQASGLSGKVWTALRLRSLTKERHAIFFQMVKEADRIVAVCDWAHKLLLRNGADPEKVVLSRQGLSQAIESPVDRRRPRPPIRLASFGRMDPAKGFHILARAIRQSPDLPVTLDIYGVEQGETGARYSRIIRSIARGDSRIMLREPVSSAQIVRLMQEYDFLAVPSLWLETGPLVVYEAFAAGVPVLGSRLGSVNELVRNDVDGLLVEPRSIEDWKKTLGRICSEPGLIERLRSGVRSPRTMRDVSREMQALYRQALK